jgi:hypothetical protein
MVSVKVMVFNSTLNNISIISGWFVWLVQETAENHWAVANKLYHIMLYRIHLTWVGFELTTLVVIGTDCIGSFKSNYHTIPTSTSPDHMVVELVTTYAITTWVVCLIPVPGMLFCDKCLTVAFSKSVVFSWYSGFLHQ